jgi:hypothetical protein
LPCFSATSRSDHMSRWFAGELWVMVPGLVAAATPDTVVAAVAASPVAISVAVVTAGPLAVVVERCGDTVARSEFRC